MISVLIPAYNNDKTLLRVLDSICDQTIFPSLEIIISDDCSPDPIGLAPDFDRFRKLQNIKWYRQDINLGVLGNARFLTKKASFRYVTFTQHDDYLIDPNFFERSIKIFESNPSVGCVFANAKFENSDQKFITDSSCKIEIIDGVNFSKIFWKKLMTSWSSIIFDNHELQRYGGFGGAYCLNEAEGHLYSAYIQEEGMGFLYLLAINKSFVIDRNVATVRGLPDSRFSISDLNPARKFKNDVLFFVYWRLANICQEHGISGNKIAKNLRSTGAKFGIEHINPEIEDFFGTSLLGRKHIIAALFFGKFKKLIYFKNIVRGRFKQLILTVLCKLNLYSRP